MTILERSENADEREESGAEIGNRHAGLDRRTAALAGDRHDARHALRDEIESAFAAVGAGLSVARDRGVDEPRIDCLQRFVVESKRREHTWPIILDENVHSSREVHERVAAFGRLEVEDDAALATVDGVEAGAVGAD